jgi:hypothetical protein
VVALPGQFGGWAAHLIYHLGRIGTYRFGGSIRWVMVGSGLIRHRRAAGRCPPMALDRPNPGEYFAFSRPPSCFSYGIGPAGAAPGAGLDGQSHPAKGPGLPQAPCTACSNRSALSWLVVVGLMMGLLPCGLSYAAFASEPWPAGRCLLQGLQMALFIRTGHAARAARGGFRCSPIFQTLPGANRTGLRYSS